MTVLNCKPLFLIHDAMVVDIKEKDIPSLTRIIEKGIFFG